MDRVQDFSGQSLNSNALQLTDIVRLLRTHARWWAVPAIGCAFVALVYSFVAPREWKATQALIVRAEAATINDSRLGKFTDLSEMKTSQETILEVAKSQAVIGAALCEVGPPANYSHLADWPTALDVEGFRDCVDMRPPGGAEFGKTEVFYLTVKDTNRARASALVVALCGQLEKRLQALHGQNAQGMITEFEQTVSMADGDLKAQTAKLSAFESNIGADLAELRSLNADASSQSEVSQVLQGIESERRANESSRNESERLLKVLVAAQKDPKQLLATPNNLLVSQPSVSQLKNALVAAQLRTADLLGTRSENHPYVIAARESESQIQKQLNDEVAVAIRGLESDVALCSDREKSLNSRLTTARERISRLASARAEYANLVASVQNHTRLVESARKNLADARARQAGAESASVISRIDGVEAGIRPAGPSRKTITAAGGVGGLLIGFAGVFLFGSVNPVVVPVASNVVAKESTRPTAVEVSSTVVRSRPVAEAFGMFRGMTLQEAVQAVEGRSR